MKSRRTQHYHYHESEELPQNVKFEFYNNLLSIETYNQAKDSFNQRTLMNKEGIENLIQFLSECLEESKVPF